MLASAVQTRRMTKGREVHGRMAASLDVATQLLLHAHTTVTLAHGLRVNHLLHVARARVIPNLAEASLQHVDCDLLLRKLLAGGPNTIL